MVTFVAYIHKPYFSYISFFNRKVSAGNHSTQLKCSNLVSWNIFQRRPHLVRCKLERVVLKIQVYDVLRITWQRRERFVLFIDH